MEHSYYGSMKKVPGRPKKKLDEMILVEQIDEIIRKRTENFDEQLKQLFVDVRGEYAVELRVLRKGIADLKKDMDRLEKVVKALL
jgi:hypothetical protein